MLDVSKEIASRLLNRIKLKLKLTIQKTTTDHTALNLHGIFFSLSSLECENTPPPLFLTLFMPFMNIFFPVFFGCFIPFCKRTSKKFSIDLWQREKKWLKPSCAQRIIKTSNFKAFFFSTIVKKEVWVNPKAETKWVWSFLFRRIQTKKTNKFNHVESVCRCFSSISLPRFYLLKWLYASRKLGLFDNTISLNGFSNSIDDLFSWNRFQSPFRQHRIRLLVAY